MEGPGRVPRYYCLHFTDRVPSPGVVTRLSVGGSQDGLSTSIFSWRLRVEPGGFLRKSHLPIKIVKFVRLPLAKIHPSLNHVSGLSMSPVLSFHCILGSSSPPPPDTGAVTVGRSQCVTSTRRVPRGTTLGVPILPLRPLPSLSIRYRIHRCPWSSNCAVKSLSQT